jgi:heme A synthase
MTKLKWLILLLLLAFLIIYLEWGKGNSMFVFQMEYEILAGKTDTKNVFMHPLVAMPFIGQLLLLFSLFQKQSNRKLIVASIVLMGILVFMCLLAGVLSKNLRIVGSTLPFITIAILVVKAGRKNKNNPELVNS